jgi:hypothetical protein
MKFPRPNHKQRGRRHFLQPATPKRYHSLFSGSEYGVVSAGREAMACHFEVRFSTRDRSKIGVVQDGLDEIDRLEGVMSAYRDDSESKPEKVCSPS